MVSCVRDTEFRGPAAMVAELLYDVTVYARAESTVESAQRRVNVRLQDKRFITAPTSQAVIQNVKLDNIHAVEWDDAWRVYHQTATYRVWARDDNTL